MSNIRQKIEELAHPIQIDGTYYNIYDTDQLCTLFEKMCNEVIGEQTHRKDCPDDGFTCVCEMWQQNYNAVRTTQTQALKTKLGE